MKAGENPYLSPLLASDELLKGLKNVHIVVGSGDPLYDASWKFFERITKIESKC